MLLHPFSTPNKCLWRELMSLRAPCIVSSPGFYAEPHLAAHSLKLVVPSMLPHHPRPQRSPALAAGSAQRRHGAPCVGSKFSSTSASPSQSPPALPPPLPPLRARLRSSCFSAFFPERCPAGRHGERGRPQSVGHPGRPAWRQ